MREGECTHWWRRRVGKSAKSFLYLAVRSEVVPNMLPMRSLFLLRKTPNPVIGCAGCCVLDGVHLSFAFFPSSIPVVPRLPGVYKGLPGLSAGVPNKCPHHVHAGREPCVGERERVTVKALFGDMPFFLRLPPLPPFPPKVWRGDT